MHSKFQEHEIITAIHDFLSYMFLNGVVTFRSQQALSQTLGKSEAELSEEE